MHPSVPQQSSARSGAGEMAVLIDQFDWSATPLGDKDRWPANLKFTVDLMLHSAFPMLLLWGKDQICIYNDAFRPALGITGHPAALGGNGKMVWPQIWNMIEPLINSVMEGQNSGLFEDQYVPTFRNGLIEDSYWTFSYNPVKNEKGVIDGVLAICHETTGKIKEKNAADAVREQLQLALEACDLGTWELEPQTMIFKCNEKTREIFGLSGGSAINLRLALSVIHPDDRQAVEESIRKAFEFQSGGKYHIEYTVVHPDTGVERIVRAVGKVYFNSQRVAEKFAGTIQDITLDKNSFRRKEKLQQLVEHSPDYISMATLNGEMTYMNPAGRQLVGLTADASLSLLSIRDFYSEEQFLQIRNEVVPAMEKEGHWTGFIKIRNVQTLEEIPCHAHYLLIRDPQTQKPISRGLTLRDLRPDLQARKELEDSEKRFRNLVQEAPVATAIYIGREMRIQWANDAMIKLWGKDKSVIGKTVREALPEIEDQPFHGQLDHVYTSGEIYQATEDKGELVVDGQLQTFYFNFSYKPLRDVDGKVYGILNMAIDVTDMVRNKRKLEESEKAFRTLIMQAPIGICLLTGEDFIVDIANEQYLHLVGREREGFEHKPIWEVVPEAKAQGFDKLLENVKRTGVPYFGNETPVELIRNGTTELVYLNFVYEPLFDEEGSVQSILVIAIDISQQVRLRQLIENAEERARLAVSSGNLGTYEVNLRTGTVISSARFNELFDIDSDQKHFEYISRIHPDDLTVRENAHNIALSTGMLHYECRIIRRDGTESWIAIFGRYYFDEMVKPYRIIGIVQDITSRKNIEQELERRVLERTEELVKLNEELQQFTYLSSHDLKEPLRKIQVFGSLALEHAGKGNSKLLTSLEKVIQSASRMSTLLNDLIHYSTLSDRSSPFTQVDLTGIVQNVIDEAEVLINEKHAIIHLNRLPMIEGISFQLTRLFSNLLQNALKFSKSDQAPEIEITSALVSDVEKRMVGLTLPVNYYKISVQDNGIGFDPAMSEKIFLVFQRLHDRNTYSGTGIGLALCKKIVENHHGKIMASSQKNKGSVFTVILPERRINTY